MEKKTLKIKFTDCPTKDFEKNSFITRFLEKHYDLEFSDDPDYLVYSCFGYEHTKYNNCVKIFYTGECVTPDFNMCDYAIGFDRISFGDRYLRVPYYLHYPSREPMMYELAESRHENADRIAAEKRDFCSFTVSNGFYGMPERKAFFNLLSEYKRVDSGGKTMNNIGGPVADKLEFDRKHKFSIAFENCKYKGYTTEKIVDAFAAGCIPIYLGDEDVTIDINPKAFISGHDYATLEELRDAVIKIDSDDEAYLAMLKEPVFINKPSFDEFERFMLSIFEQDISRARRRSHSIWVRDQEQLYKKAYKVIKFEKTKIMQFVQKHYVKLKKALKRKK